MILFSSLSVRFSSSVKLETLMTLTLAAVKATVRDKERKNIMVCLLINNASETLTTL